MFIKNGDIKVAKPRHNLGMDTTRKEKARKAPKSTIINDAKTGNISDVNLHREGARLAQMTNSPLGTIMYLKPEES